MDSLELWISKVQKSLEEYKSMKSNSTSQTMVRGDTRDSIDNEVIFKDIGTKFNYLQSDLEELRSHFSKWVKEI